MAASVGEPLSEEIIEAVNHLKCTIDDLVTTIGDKEYETPEQRHQSMQALVGLLEATAEDLGVYADWGSGSP